MISVKSFSSKVKSMNSSFIKNMNIFDIFYQFPQFEHTESEVWKGKNLCAWGVKAKAGEFKLKLSTSFPTAATGR